MEEATPLSHQANASDCFFVFNDDACVCVCDPHLYPVGRTPSFFLCMFTHLKNDKKGEGGPRAVGRAPDPSPDHFCCVLTLFEYFKAHPGRRETLALSAHGPGVAWSEMRTLCHLAASEAGIDPTRLVPHSARAGALAQYERESDATRQQQGGWLSLKGLQALRSESVGPRPCDGGGLARLHRVSLGADSHDVWCPPYGPIRCRSRPIGCGMCV